MTGVPQVVFLDFFSGMILTALFSKSINDMKLFLKSIRGVLLRQNILLFKGCFL